jgi:hypothetical protein
MPDRIWCQGRYVHFEISDPFTDEHRGLMLAILPKAVQLVNRKVHGDRVIHHFRYRRPEGLEASEAIRWVADLLFSVRMSKRYWDVDSSPFPTPGSRTIVWLMRNDSAEAYSTVGRIVAGWEAEVRDSFDQLTSRCFVGSVDPQTFFGIDARLKQRIHRRGKLLEVAHLYLRGRKEEALKLAEELNFIEGRRRWYGALGG